MWQVAFSSKSVLKKVRPVLPTADSLIYMWASCGNRKYDPNGDDWGNASSTYMDTRRSLIKLTDARAGDLIVYGSAHVEMFMEDYHGNSTRVIGWGSAPGHYSTLGGENAYQLKYEHEKPS